MQKILTFGVFDYFHLGHLRLFKQCKEYGDYLIIGIQTDEYAKKYKPDSNILYSTSQRIEMLNSIKEVDEIFSYNELNTGLLEKIEFDILALGEDHVGQRFSDLEEWCKTHGKTVVRLKRTPGISSSSLRKNAFQDSCVED